MGENLINLKILLPFRIFADINNVAQVVMETSEGSYGLLPHRLDCVAAMVPGIFTYEIEGKMHYLAVDQGILIKEGTQVIVSVRNAIGGSDLGKLRESVEKEFLDMDENEKTIRRAMAKIESGLMYYMEKYRRQ
jgi:F-type H+-transporting ATPase subunit epsilon